MRRSNTQPLSHLMKEYIQENNIDSKFKEVEVIQYCQELLGKAMGKYLMAISLKEKVLYLRISSPVVKSELLMLREEIRTRLNDKAGEEVVVKIVFR
jgi:hypothetical protein